MSVAQTIDAPGRGSGAHATKLDKATLHSTEGGSIEGAIAAYRQHSSWPNRTVDYRKGRRRVANHVPLDQAARALRNTATPGETNRDGTIQYELVGNAAAILSQYDEADWLALGADIIGPDCRRMGIPLVCAVTMPTYPPPNGERLGRESTRLTRAEMDRTVGLVGHANWPENTHGDPGPLTAPHYRGGTVSAIDLILEGAGATPKPPAQEDDMPTAEEIREIVREEVGRAIGWTRAVAESPNVADTDSQSQRLKDRAAHLNPERKA